MRVALAVETEAVDDELPRPLGRRARGEVEAGLVGGRVVWVGRGLGGRERRVQDIDLALRSKVSLWERSEEGRGGRTLA